MELRKKFYIVILLLIILAIIIIILSISHENKNKSSSTEQNIQSKLINIEPKPDDESPFPYSLWSNEYSLQKIPEELRINTQNIALSEEILRKNKEFLWEYTPINAELQNDGTEESKRFNKTLLGKFKNLYTGLPLNFVPYNRLPKNYYPISFSPDNSLDDNQDKSLGINKKYLRMEGLPDLLEKTYMRFTHLGRNSYLSVKDDKEKLKRDNNSIHFIKNNNKLTDIIDFGDHEEINKVWNIRKVYDNIYIIVRNFDISDNNDILSNNNNQNLLTANFRRKIIYPMKDMRLFLRQFNQWLLSDKDRVSKFCEIKAKLNIDKTTNFSYRPAVRIVNYALLKKINFDIQNDVELLYVNCFRINRKTAIFPTRQIDIINNFQTLNNPRDNNLMLFYENKNISYSNCGIFEFLAPNGRYILKPHTSLSTHMGCFQDSENGTCSENEFDKNDNLDGNINKQVSDNDYFEPIYSLMTTMDFKSTFKIPVKDQNYMDTSVYLDTSNSIIEILKKMKEGPSKDTDVEYNNRIKPLFELFVDFIHDREEYKIQCCSNGSKFMDRFCENIIKNSNKCPFSKLEMCTNEGVCEIKSFWSVICNNMSYEKPTEITEGKNCELFINKYCETNIERINKIPKDISDENYKKNEQLCACYTDDNPDALNRDFFNRIREFPNIDVDSTKACYFADCRDANAFKTKKQITESKNCKSFCGVINNNIATGNSSIIESNSIVVNCSNSEDDTFSARRCKSIQEPVTNLCKLPCGNNEEVKRIITYTYSSDEEDEIIKEACSNKPRYEKNINCDTYEEGGVTLCSLNSPDTPINPPEEPVTPITPDTPPEEPVTPPDEEIPEEEIPPIIDPNKFNNPESSGLSTPQIVLISSGSIILLILIIIGIYMLIKTRKNMVSNQ